MLKRAIAAAAVTAYWLGTSCLFAATLRQDTGPPPVQSFPDAAKQIAIPRGDATRPKVPQYATRHQRFSLQYSVVADSQVIVEVILHVSSDRGQSWREAARGDLRQTEFHYAAPADGEYWLAVQTLNRNGLRVPPQVTLPDMIVLVDSVPPRLQAAAGTDPAGRVTVTWEGRDDHLSTDCLAIRYRPSGGDDAAWIDVPVRLAQAPSGPLVQDKYAFWPESNQANLELEIGLRDQAGNQATTRTEIHRTNVAPQFAPLAANPTGPAAPSGVASSTSDSQGWVRSQAPRGSAPRNAGYQRHELQASTEHRSANPRPDSSPTERGTIRLQPQVPSVEWRSARHSASGKFSARGSTTDPPATTAPIPPIRVADPPNAQFPTRSAPLQASPDLLANAPPRSTNPLPTRLATDRTENPLVGDLHSVLSTPPISAAIREQTVFVNSKRFRINYQIEAIEAADLKEVAVWATRDGGKTWNRMGSAADPMGPYPVEVDGSGLYGFRLVIAGQNGTKGRLPQPGDPADKWIQVDVDPPLVKIKSAPYGTGSEAGKLVVEWEIHDAQLALRPLTLAYSIAAQGPWTAIESGLRDTGRFVWAVPDNGPEKVFLRLTARDEAGNESHDQTPYPIDLTNLHPRGRIQSVEPIRD